MSNHCTFLVGMGAVRLILIDTAQCQMSTVVLTGLFQNKRLVILHGLYIF